VFDDARHFMLTAKERFDVITSDPIHPWVRGAAALYTREYYELVKQRLNPGGVVTQWVPLYETDEASVQSQLATFFDAFPEGTMWNSAKLGAGYDLAVMGTVTAPSIDLDATDAMLDSNAQARTHLTEVELGSAVRLFMTYSGRGRDLAPWLTQAQRNEDVALRLQYLAGLSFDRHDEQKIFDATQRYRTWPADLFVGAPDQLQALRAILGL
jgi:spermidine synthase